MASKAQLEANKCYIKSQDNVTIRMPKGKKDMLVVHARAQGESLKSLLTALSTKLWSATTQKILRNNPKEIKNVLPLRQHKKVVFVIII